MISRRDTLTATATGAMVTAATTARAASFGNPDEPPQGAIARRQSFWDRGRLKIRESLARLICNVMRPADGAASGDWQLSVV
jgi:hypothetical protein